MMTSTEIIAELKSKGSASIKKVFLSHGAPEPIFGVKVGDMKPLQKKLKKNYALSMELYDSGISDAMYLAGLISDPQQMTQEDLQHWAEKATWQMISEYAVAWTAAESPFALEMARKWIKADKELIECAGWNTYSSYIGITPNEKLDIQEITSLIEFVSKHIHQAKNRVRYTMNNFVISAGGYIPELRSTAIQAAEKIGKISVDLGGTACKVPEAVSYIQKMADHGSENKKKKTAKC
jgi:3-methyladenine DNA glycosylase AlkD